MKLMFRSEQAVVRPDMPVGDPERQHKLIDRNALQNEYHPVFAVKEVRKDNGEKAERTSERMVDESRSEDQVAIDEARMVMRLRHKHVVSMTSLFLADAGLR